MDKKIAVLATGANGSCIAADLIRAELDVSMIDQWAEHVEAICTNGLTITTDDEEYNVAAKAYHLSDVCTLNEKFDVVLLTSKAYDSRWLAEFIKPYLADDGLVVAVQNCMTAEMIADIVGPARTVGCVVELSSQLFDPAKIRRNTDTSQTWFGLGVFDAAHEDRLKDAVEVLRHAGEVEITDDIISAKWMKLIVNAMTMGLKAILGATNGQVFKLNGARELFLRAGEEALAAGQLLDYKVVPIFGLKPEDVENTNNLLETLLEKITRDVGPTAINTVLQDHLKGRYSEIDLINGLVADESAKNGLLTPVSDVLINLTWRIHTGDLEPDLANIDLIRQALDT